MMEEQDRKRKASVENVAIQAEQTEIMINYEDANSQQHVMGTHVAMQSRLPNDPDMMYLNLEVEETLDPTSMAAVLEDSNETATNSMQTNRRFLEAVIEEPSLANTNICNDIRADLGPIVGYASEPLLPLYKACASLTEILHNIPFYVQLALDKTSEHPPDGLTIDESAAIRLYTIEWRKPHRSLYSMLNYTLKTADRKDLRPYYKYLKLFLTALAKLPCTPPSTIWRGVAMNLSAEFPPGTPVTWWAFSSCTTSLAVLENQLYLGNTGNRTLFSVEAINGRAIRQHSHFRTEDEILLLPGTHMVVQSQMSPTSDLHIIHLKQIVPDEMLLESPFEGILNIFNLFFTNYSMLILRCTSLSENWVSQTSSFPKCVFVENSHYIY